MTRSRPLAPPASTAGFTLLELVVALSLLTVFSLVLTPLLVSVGEARRLNTQRQLAVQLASNLLEDVSTRPPIQLQPVSREWPPTDLPARLPLPGLRRQVDIAPVDGEPATRRIRVTVSWTTRQQRPPQTVALEAYAFLTGESAP